LSLASAVSVATAASPVASSVDTPFAAAATARMNNPNRPVPWWVEIGRKPDSFYRSDEGRRMAENILSWQDAATGGWPLMNTTREPFTGDESKAGPWGRRAALIKATVNEMRFLARAHRATEDERFRTAVLAGLEFILAAQYPSGGWPHSYPPRATDYSRFATFNDDLLPDLMSLLHEVGNTREFVLVGPEARARARAAFERGLEFVLRTQIMVDGRPTGWAQQYDPDTLEPRPARAFEPVAISGGESASVLRMLMELPKPSPAVIAAVEAGVQWYRDAQIDGLRVIHGDGDRIAVADPTAPPVWARFYEIGTGRPIFAGRDGVIRYALAEIEQERRNGYAWYNHHGTALFARHAEWRYARAWDAQPPTNTDESKVGDLPLPPLLVTSDGSPVRTVEEWENTRRPEIMRLVEQHQHGVTPSTPVRTTFDVIERDAPALDGLARRTQARIRFPDHPDGPVVRVLLNLPKGADGPVPTILHLSFSPNVLMQDEPGIDEGTAWSGTLKAPIPDRDAINLGLFDTRCFLERGYGVALVYYGDVYPDFNHGHTLGVHRLFPAPPDTGAPDRWGAIGAWAWGLSRVMDYLQTEPGVDGTRVALSGFSRLGKTVLWAGAQDRRFAMVIPLLSGEGGAASSRRFYGETVADLTNPSRYPYWFAPRYADYAFDVASLPVDGHMLLALIAPRPILQVVGSEDTWSDPRGEFVTARAASEVWRLYGKTGLQADDFPPLDTLVTGDMGFLVHDGGHKALPIDYRAMADFMDLHFRR
jgi:PelA/Pel-15E family pectate lyase